MRHGSSLIVAMEGMSRTAFRIARELAQNSRAGLTPRFFSRKFGISESEIEYFIDLHDRLFYFDLTRVRLVAEGIAAVSRVCSGLENHGDVPSLVKIVRELDAHDFRKLEEQLALNVPSSRNKAAQVLVEKWYGHPEAIVEYVAQGGFSRKAREVFDAVWQSDRGILSANDLRTLTTFDEYDVEKALNELFQGFALFELFRFDQEDRLVRFIAILHELRQWREAKADRSVSDASPKPFKKKPAAVKTRGLVFSTLVCRLIAAIAARPVRVRSSGELFREDSRRLAEICGYEDLEPTLEMLIWAAEGVGWLGSVDNEIRVNNLDTLQDITQLNRHRMLFNWFFDCRCDPGTKSLITRFVQQSKPNVWYFLSDFLRWAVNASVEHEECQLRNVGGHWSYMGRNVSANFERNLARALEEELFWLGAIDRSETDEETLFRVTDLGRYLFLGELSPTLEAHQVCSNSQFIVQPNFEIVVPARDMDPLFLVPLERFAIRVSEGNVLVYKMTRVSFMKALQDGHDGVTFIQFLIRNNRTQELPANVLTTLQDWCGSVKRVKLRTMHVLESEDPLVIADIANRRRLKSHIRPLDSARIIEYHGLTRKEIVKELEREGFVVD